MSFLDRLRRVFAREAQPTLQLRAYEAADKGRQTYGWRAPKTSANAEVVPQLGTMRDRCRDLVRNNPLAKRAVGVITNSVVGSRGIQPRWSRIADSALRERARAMWIEWSRKCDTSGRLSLPLVQRQAVHALLESGEVFVRRRLGGPARVPLRLMPMEPDWLDEMTYPAEISGRRSIGGVVVDDEGEVVAYRLRRQHPGDGFLLPRQSAEIDEVDASEVCHLYDPTRPGQLRGVPLLHSVVMTLRIMGDFETAELIRREAQATLAMVVRGAAPPTTSSVTEPGEVTGMGMAVQDSNGQTMETLAPGTIYYASGAEGIDMTSPQSDPSFRTVAEYYQHKVAAGTGVPFAQLSTDLSAVNYSSFRAGQLDFRAETLRLRNFCVIPMLCDPLWAWFRAAAAVTDPSMLDLPEFIEWTQPVWQSVEPQKDSDAQTSRIRGGLSSLSAEIEDHGEDPAEVFAQLAADKAALAALGVTVDTIRTDPTP